MRMGTAAEREEEEKRGEFGDGTLAASEESD